MAEMFAPIIPAVSVIATILIAATGWYISHRNAIRLDRRKARLELINKQLNNFYGPLYVSTQAGRIAYETLLKRLGRSAVNPKGEFLNDRDKNEWTIWLKHVLTPLNDVRENLIIHNAYLIREEEIPQCLLDFVAHVAAYKAVLAKWDANDYSTLFSVIDCPKDLDEYSRSSYQDLKREQAILIGEQTKKSPISHAITQAENISTCSQISMASHAQGG